MFQGGRAYRVRLRVSVCALAIVSIAVPARAQRRTASAPPKFAAAPSAHLPDSDRAYANLNKLPIRFEPLAENGTFLARGIGPAVRLSGTSIDFPIGAVPQNAETIRVQFVGARKSSRVTGLDPLPGRVNYLLGDDPARWRTNVRTYARAHTRALYRGIDVVYYGAGDQLEYDLVVRPGADPDSIGLAISGAAVAISDAGDLVHGSDDRVLLRKPIAYQTSRGVRRDVTVAYRQREDGSVGFAVGAYDRKQILVIDPIVAYSFSFGGSGDEQVYDIAADETGAVYVGGETYSINFPTVKPAQNRDDAGEPCIFYGNSICRDAFLAKLAADGKSLEYATYFGSDDFDQVNHIVVDSSHALYFAGWTTTQTTSPQPDVRSSFIGKLAPDGSHFIYTYFSPRCCTTGPQLMINDLAVGPDGAAYVAVSTPTTSEVATLSPAGDNYHSLYTLTDPSGIRRTSFNAIAIQGDSVFVGGNTTWSGFPTTRGVAFKPVRKGVLMRLTLTGSVVYSVFVYSGFDVSTVTDVAVDQNGAVHVVGDERPTDNTCISSSLPPPDMFVRTLNPDGSDSPYGNALIPYPTSGCVQSPVRIAVNALGNAYTAGCGFGPEAGAAGVLCTLWKVSPGGVKTFEYVPWHRFTIDANAIAKWFAPVTGQVSIIKSVSTLSLTALVATPSPARFATLISFFPIVAADGGDVETSFWRYDANGGWREVQAFTPWLYPWLAPYSWTSAWWDVGEHQMCVFARLVGSTDPPQSACVKFSIAGVGTGEASVLPPAADFNTDHRPDLVWTNEATGQLAVWNLGGGLNGERVIDGGYLNSAPLPAGWHVVGAGDVDADGHTDLFLQSDAGQLAVWMFDGATLRGGMLLTPGQLSDPNWQIRAVGDLNHDGHPDLIWQYAPTGQVAFWLMNGTSAIGYVIPNVAAPGADWEIVGSGDSNRDGNPDIFWQQRSTGNLAVWWMNGTSLGTAGLLQHPPIDPKWRVVAVADLDGDAHSDVVFQHTDTREVAAWYLLPIRWRFGTLLNPSAVSPSWKVVGPR